jgi:tetratricopeptide (TPR) repeat protein
MKVLLAAVLCLAACKKSGVTAQLDQANQALFAHKPQLALEAYKQALDLLEQDDSKEATVYRARALRGAADTYYLELHDYKRAVEVYRELIQLCPEAPETLDGRLHLADLLEREFHDTRGAITELTSAIARNPPQSAELSYKVATLYFGLGDYQQCEIEASNLAKKFETSPFVDDALLLRGQALAMMDGKKAEALKAFEELAERFPDSELQPHALFEAGKVLAEQGETERAIEKWIASLKKHPDPQVVQTVIARVRQQMRKTTPVAVGDATRAFDRDVPGSFVGPAKPAPMPKTSAEAVGGEEHAGRARADGSSETGGRAGARPRACARAGPVNFARSLPSMPGVTSLADP